MKPRASSLPGALGAGTPFLGKTQCPQGRDRPCSRHINQLRLLERLTRALLSLSKVTSHIYNVPVKPISCESVVGAAFYWILVNSELLK